MELTTGPGYDGSSVRMGPKRIRAPLPIPPGISRIQPHLIIVSRGNNGAFSTAMARGASVLEQDVMDPDDAATHAANIGDLPETVGGVRIPRALYILLFRLTARDGRVSPSNAAFFGRILALALDAARELFVNWRHADRAVVGASDAKSWDARTRQIAATALTLFSGQALTIIPWGIVVYSSNAAALRVLLPLVKRINVEKFATCLSIRIARGLALAIKKGASTSGAVRAALIVVVCRALALCGYTELTRILGEYTRSPGGVGTIEALATLTNGDFANAELLSAPLHGPRATARAALKPEEAVLAAIVSGRPIAGEAGLRATPDVDASVKINARRVLYTDDIHKNQVVEGAPPSPPLVMALSDDLSKLPSTGKDLEKALGPMGLKPAFENNPPTPSGLDRFTQLSEPEGE